MLGFVVLFFALVVIGVGQVALALGMMFSMHKLKPQLPRMTETAYGEFDFDNYQQPAFQDLLVKLAAIFMGTTVVLHMLEYILIGKKILYHPGLVALMLFILETAAIGAGLHYIFRLDRFRLIVLTAGSAFFYFFFLWYLTSGNMLRT